MCYLCRWVLLISHPQDFTPVCTTELGHIARHKQEFSDRNVKVLAHSVDDLQSHIEWVKVSSTITAIFDNFCHSHSLYL